MGVGSVCLPLSINEPVDIEEGALQPEVVLVSQRGVRIAIRRSREGTYSGICAKITSYYISQCYCMFNIRMRGNSYLPHELRYHGLACVVGLLSDNVCQNSTKGLEDGWIVDDDRCLMVICNLD